MVLPGQGLYHNPDFYEMDPNTPGGKHVTIKGYATDIITDKSLDWLKNRDPDRPFFLMCHHKAPHRPWQPDEKHKEMFNDIEIPYPETFNDDYTTSKARKNARMRIERDFDCEDIKVLPPIGAGWKSRLEPPKESEIAKYELEPINFFDEDEECEPLTFKSLEERKKVFYQRYIKDYLRVIASIDDNIGRLLDYLDQSGLAENTIVIYTSDQGFFLGDHGWYDKRFMYEESLRMPYVIRFPKEIPGGTVNKDLIMNLDFSPTWLDYANAAIPPYIQGKSFREIAKGNKIENWRTSMYYRYWMNRDISHDTTAHYGIRTVGPDRNEYKLIYYYADGMGIADNDKTSFGAENQTDASEFIREWEFFDLTKDPFEMENRYTSSEYQEIIRQLKTELHTLQIEVQDSIFDKEN
jgi:arylsulfatase A-like enzyme